MPGVEMGGEKLAEATERLIDLIANRGGETGELFANSIRGDRRRSSRGIESIALFFFFWVASPAPKQRPTAENYPSPRQSDWIEACRTARRSLIGSMHMMPYRVEPADTMSRPDDPDPMDAILRIILQDARNKIRAVSSLCIHCLSMQPRFDERPQLVHSRLTRNRAEPRAPTWKFTLDSPRRRSRETMN